MANLRTMLTLAVAAASFACGSSATGISVAIDPDPVPAQATATLSTYSAGWDVVVADLTGLGGTVESVEAAVGGVTVTTATPVRGTDAAARESPNAGSVVLPPFARRIFRQSASFSLTGSQPGQMSVTVRFRDESGQVHEGTATARLTLR